MVITCFSCVFFWYYYYYYYIYLIQIGVWFLMSLCIECFLAVSSLQSFRVSRKALQVTWLPAKVTLKQIRSKGNIKENVHHLSTIMISIILSMWSIIDTHNNKLLVRLTVRCDSLTACINNVVKVLLVRSLITVFSILVLIRPPQQQQQAEASRNILSSKMLPGTVWICF